MIKAKTMIKAGMEPQDATRFAEGVRLRMSLAERQDRIMQNLDISERVKQARLNFTRKEMLALLAEVEVLIAKYQERLNVSNP